jgi:hypothetical protein
MTMTMTMTMTTSEAVVEEPGTRCDDVGGSDDIGKGCAFVPRGRGGRVSASERDPICDCDCGVDGVDCAREVPCSQTCGSGQAVGTLVANPDARPGGAGLELVFETAAEAEHRRRIAELIISRRDPASAGDEAGSEVGDTADFDLAVWQSNRDVDTAVFPNQLYRRVAPSAFLSSC